MSDAFDANILIHLVTGSRWGPSCGAALRRARLRIGSVLLLPEVLAKPLRMGASAEFADLADVLATFALHSVDEEVADASVTLAAKYGLKAVDAVHLATAVVWGAARFHTTNTKDFGSHIAEVEVVVPG